MLCTCRGEKLFPNFIAALKAKEGTDEESKKIGVLVQVCCKQVNDVLTQVRHCLGKCMHHGDLM